MKRSRFTEEQIIGIQALSPTGECRHSSDGGEGMRAVKNRGQSADGGEGMRAVKNRGQSAIYDVDFAG